MGAYKLISFLLRYVYVFVFSLRLWNKTFVILSYLISEFNEVVALDIKFIDQKPVLHLIDHATRYSMACRLRNKRAETVVENALNLWIRVFGSPSKYFITDNGGEFVNDELRELCEKFWKFF